MDAPSADFRARVQGWCEELRGAQRSTSFFVDVALEDGLDSILDEISAALSETLERGPQSDADEVLARIDASVSLASYATVRTYGPESPWWRGLAGWRPSAVKRLRRIASELQGDLERAAALVHSGGWSVGASFPAGLAIGLSWSTETAKLRRQWEREADALWRRAKLPWSAYEAACPGADDLSYHVPVRDEEVEFREGGRPKIFPTTACILQSVTPEPPS
ncbi:MAG: hypothetical protein WA751_06135 [Candidatus Dormiibacterota bacterium]